MMKWLELPPVKIGISLLLWLAVAPFVWWFFRGTWRELDAEAVELRRDLAARGTIDYRPMVALMLVAFIQTFQEYYGRPDFYIRAIAGAVERHAHAHPGSIFNPRVYDE